jgi:hypothetical protein
MRVLLLVALLLALAGCDGSPLESSLAARADLAPAAFAIETPVARAPAEPREAPKRADASLDRSGESPIKSHVLFLPPSFSSADGAFDVVIFFHGHRPIVRESFERANLDAAVISVNLGEGARLYEQAFVAPGGLAGLLARAPQILEKRGLRDARVRRIALASWSAGYGAILRILAQPEHAQRVDAVMLLDGLHARRLPDSGAIDAQDLAPFAVFAERAARGEALMIVTHNDIVPERADLASVTASVELLLDRLDLERTPDARPVLPPSLTAIEGVYSSRKRFELSSASVARRKGFVVRGFAGRTPEDHIAQLLALGPLALEPLGERWHAPEG